MISSGVFLNSIIQRNYMKDIHKLSFVLVYPLDMNIKQGFW